jgi:hypothetical protein
MLLDRTGELLREAELPMPRRVLHSKLPSSSLQSALVPQSPRAVNKGGTVICGGIHSINCATFRRDSKNL